MREEERIGQKKDVKTYRMKEKSEEERLAGVKTGRLRRNRKRREAEEEK